MVVRIRFAYPPAGRTVASRSRRVVLAIASLLTPLALLAWVLGFWRLAADFGWTGAFAISGGVLSHWQVWLAIGFVVQFAGFLIHRIIRRQYDHDDAAA